MSSKSRIAIFASGSGSNAEEIIKYFKNHSTVEVVLLLSNNPEAYALERAKKFNIHAQAFSRSQFKNGDELLQWLHNEKVTHIVLAGFLWLIPDYLIKNYPDRIINIHPALLPRFGGKGMYGMRVHEAVKSAGEKETGITIHLVNEHYDEGKILFQGRCDIGNDATPEEIAACVHKLEYEFYPKVIEKWILDI